MRKTLAVLGGLAIAGFVIVLLKIPNAIFFEKEVAKMDTSNFIVPDKMALMVLVAYIVGAFFGGLFSTLISKNKNSVWAIVVGFILTFWGIINTINVNYPNWFWINLLVHVPMSYWGFKVINKHKKAIIDTPEKKKDTFSK